MFICKEFFHLFHNLHSIQIKTVYNLRPKAILLNGLNILMKEMTFIRNYFGLVESVRESSRMWDSSKHDHPYCDTKSTITLMFYFFSCNAHNMIIKWTTYTNIFFILLSSGTILRTFALIVSAHPYCARKFTCHVMHRARALNTKLNNNRADGLCYSFAWI